MSEMKSEFKQFDLQDTSEVSISDSANDSIVPLTESQILDSNLSGLKDFCDSTEDNKIMDMYIISIRRQFDKLLNIHQQSQTTLTPEEQQALWKVAKHIVSETIRHGEFTDENKEVYARNKEIMEEEWFNIMEDAITHKTFNAEQERRGK